MNVKLQQISDVIMNQNKTIKNKYEFRFEK